MLAPSSHSLCSVAHGQPFICDYRCQQFNNERTPHAEAKRSFWFVYSTTLHFRVLLFGFNLMPSCVESEPTQSTHTHLHYMSVTCDVPPNLRASAHQNVVQIMMAIHHRCNIVLRCCAVATRFAPRRSACEYFGCHKWIILYREPLHLHFSLCVFLVHLWCTNGARALRIQITESEMCLHNMR